MNGIRDFFCYLWRAICRLCCWCPSSNNNYDVLHDSIPVKVHVLVVRETFNTHETFIQKLKLQIERDCGPEKCDIILVFCPVVSLIETDMEAAMAGVPEDKPVILVFMHHCHNPSHMTDITVQTSRSNIVRVVKCAFHETIGLLECQENEQAVTKVHSALLRYTFRNRPSVEYVDSHAGASKVHPTQPEMKQQPIDTVDANKSQKKGPKPVSGKSDQGKVASGGVKVHMLVAGETFQAHETFMQKLKLQINPCRPESCSVILVFCPVVSRIGTDMDAAMDKVTEDKPVILVFMHHCHHPSHMTNITVQPSRSNIVQVVHCAFHESKGLLECQENKEAVDKVLSALLSRNLHAEVPQSKVLLTTSNMEKQPMAAQDANKPIITNDSEPVGEESESDQCKDQPKKDSCGSSGDLIILSEGHAPEVLQSNVDHSSMDMEEKPMAAQDGKRSRITSDSELPRKDIDPAEFPSEVPQSDVCLDMDLKQQLISTQDTDSLNITNDNAVPGKGTDPAGEKSESDQKTVVPTEEHSTGSSGELPTEVPQSNVCLDMDLKQQSISTQDTDSLNITNDNAVPGKGTDPAGEKSESDQKTVVPTEEHSTGSSGELPSEVPQSDVCIDMDLKQQLLSTQDTDSLNITNDNAVPGKGTDPAEEKSESDKKTVVPTEEHSTGSSGELPAEVPQSDVCLDMDLKQQSISTQDTDSLNITNDNAVPGKGTDPAGEKSESDKKTVVPTEEHSTGSSEGKGRLEA